VADIEAIAKILSVLSEAAYHDCEIGKHNNTALDLLGRLLIDISGGMKERLSEDIDNEKRK
jgi:hypothetical protein